VRLGATVMRPVCALHRYRAVREAPDAVDPSRFKRPVARFVWLPFGDGPRFCIGASFVLQEAVIVLATPLARFRFAPVPGKVPVPVIILKSGAQGAFGWGWSGV